jgi:hypothetical protein
MHKPCSARLQPLVCADKALKNKVLTRKSRVSRAGFRRQLFRSFFKKHAARCFVNKQFGVEMFVYVAIHS